MKFFDIFVVERAYFNTYVVMMEDVIKKKEVFNVVIILTRSYVRT